MKTHILIYEGFAQFEVILASYFLGTKSEIVTVGLDINPINSSEGFITSPHISLNELNIDEVETFIIPGGDPENLNSELLLETIKKINKNEAIIGAICSGTDQLVKAGILCNINEDIVVDGNIVTAKGNAYVDFALKLAELNNIFKDKEDYLETVKYFKEFQG